MDMKKWQVRIFAACFIAYTAAYICRVNLSIALPGIGKDLGYNNTSLGLIGTALFWVYALGQLINGTIGDKVSSRVFIFLGLIVSAILNLLFGFSSLLLVMIVIWGANGLFQSMLWGPIVKTLTNWFPLACRLPRLSFGMSITTIIGPIIAWGLSGLLLEKFGWRWVFWLPAAIVSLMACVWMILARNKPVDAGLYDADENDLQEIEVAFNDSAGNDGSSISLWKLVKDGSLIFIAISGITQGMIKDSISLWSPKFLMDTQGFSMKSAVAAVLIIPLVNFIGILFAGWLNKLLKSEEKITIMVMMAGSFLASLGLRFVIHSNAVLGIILIACVSAMMSGVNPMMTTTVPMYYKKHNKVSAVAGFIDFSIYVGSGLAGVFTGFIADRYGWNSIFAVWCLISLLGAVSMCAGILKDRTVPDADV